MQELIEGYRLSPQQEQLWQWQTDASDFRLQCAVSIKGAVRLELLAEAWKQVLRRHEILRTAFRGLAGMDLPLQVIVDDVQSAFDVKDVSGDLQAELEQQWETPFDLEHGQVVHARVLRRSSGEHVMILTLSALCGDEQSLQNLAAELMHCYSGRCLEDDAVQYVQFSEWQRELLDSEEASEAAAYWRSVRDAGTEPVRLPQELKQDEAFQRATIERVEVKISSEQKRKLESVARSCDVNLSQVLLGGWASLLMRISGHNEVRIECAFDGRKFEEMRGGIGTYTKWLPVLVQYDARTTFRQELLRIKQSQHSAWMWQEYYAADQERGIGFEYLETGRGSEAAGVRFELGAVRSWTAPLKLKLSCVDEGETVRLQVSYDTNSYNASGMERLLASLTTLLESLSESGGERVGRLPVLSAREREQVVKEWNETQAEVRSGELSVAGQFEAQVARTPAAVALVSDTETVTFAELNERANQVAHYLRGLGVGPETLVGLCLERSVAQLVGLLGIMKAGGAYVPLEPGNPAARLQYELQDAGVRVLLTDEATAQRGLWSELDLTVVLVDEISGAQGLG
ncbi:MAG TPA: condensation domain-containing protein, partial [Pyrinomonadaceae bacterium]|nr:condensation domain-containing protein [Pyrinomonadaceae bacterium]